jgi:hypothetical protein
MIFGKKFKCNFFQEIDPNEIFKKISPILSNLLDVIISCALLKFTLSIFFISSVRKSFTRSFCEEITGLIYLNVLKM